MIQQVALGVALCDADWKVREAGGNNRGPRIRQYLANTEPPITHAVPWCAAAVQYWSDVACRGLGLKNPLDDVRLEAWVQSYYDWASPHMIVPPQLAEPGDLVFFSFNKQRWDHIGLLAQRPVMASLWVVEGNTSDADQRDGDGVYLKIRGLDKGYPVAFARWGM